MPGKTIVAMLCVTAIIITCVIMGVDGWLVFAGVSIISGLGGFAVRIIRKP